MLEKQRSGHSGIAGVQINGCPVLCGAKEDFSESPIIKATDASRIPDATVLEIEQFMRAPVWEALASGHP